MNYNDFMPEPFKNFFNEELINQMTLGIARSYPQFQGDLFFNDVFDDRWEERELKERMNHIALMLGRYLPDDYSRSLVILKSASPGLSGLGHMCFPAFVELFGLEHFEESVEALESLTQYSSSEFAVRPFIIRYGNSMLEVMMEWAGSDNEHVRRLASEGCRPRLPWAMALPEFKKNPQPILPILEKLKHDESEYVRRSVANNLNDISKDHRSVLLEVAQRWLGHSLETDKLVKHACRSMLKKGDMDFLKLFGFADTDHLALQDMKVQKSVRMEEALAFSFTINTDEVSLGKLRLEYAVDFMKKNGSLARKVFKISESDFAGSIKNVETYHSFKSITTRVHYPGEHKLAIIVNGVEMAAEKFILQSEAE